MFKTYKSSGVNTNHFWLQIVAFTKNLTACDASPIAKKQSWNFSSAVLEEMGIIFYLFLMMIKRIISS